MFLVLVSCFWSHVFGLMFLVLFLLVVNPLTKFGGAEETVRNISLAFWLVWFFVWLFIACVLAGLFGCFVCLFIACVLAVFLGFFALPLYKTAVHPFFSPFFPLFHCMI